MVICERPHPLTAMIQRAQLLTKMKTLASAMVVYGHEQPGLAFQVVYPRTSNAKIRACVVSRSMTTGEQVLIAQSDEKEAEYQAIISLYAQLQKDVEERVMLNLRVPFLRSKLAELEGEKWAKNDPQVIALQQELNNAERGIKELYKGQQVQALH